MVGDKVVVTTDRCGVFFGTAATDLEDGKIALTDARVCVFWSQATRGFIGLAATGPLDGSRVSAAAPRLTLIGVTAVVHCTPEAVERWESGPWT